MNTDRRSRMLAAIAAAISTVNEQLPPNQRLEAAEDTVLVGPGSPMDSLQLVFLVVELESRLQEFEGIAADLTPLATLPPGESPFRSIGRLADMLVSLQPDAA